MIVLETKYVYHWKYLMNPYNNDAEYRVAQNKDCEAQLHEIALANLVACMEDLRKKDFISIQINMHACRPQKVGSSCLVYMLFLKVRYTLKGSNICFYLYFQISKLTHKANLIKVIEISFFSPFLFHAFFLRF